VATNKKIFKISANENTLWTLAAMLDFRSMPKNTNLVEDHPMNISGKYGSNLFRGFREEDLNVKRNRTDDNDEERRMDDDERTTDA
jgi:hypothetical protein